VAVTVTVIDELSPTRAAVGTPEAATSNVPRVLPKPLRETVRPAFTVRVAFFAPTDVGVNTIEIVQLVLGVPQVWAEMANPPPSTGVGHGHRLGRTVLIDVHFVEVEKPG
jgi:hypothetical protein